MFYRPRRRPSTMKAAIQASGREMSVDVLDVSEVGMRLEVRGSFSEGQSATIVTPRMRLPCIVIWARGAEIGVKLDQKLSSSQMTELSGLSWGL